MAEKAAEYLLPIHLTVIFNCGRSGISTKFNEGELEQAYQTLENNEVTELEDCSRISIK